MTLTPDTATAPQETKPQTLVPNAFSSSLESQFPNLTEEQMFLVYMEIYKSVWRIQLAPYFTGFSDDQMLTILEVIPEVARLVHTGVYSANLETLMDDNPFLYEPHDGIKTIAGKPIRVIVPALRELIERGILSFDVQNLPLLKKVPNPEDP